MTDLRARAIALTAAHTAASRLSEVACPKRQARAQAVRVLGLVITDEAVHAAVQSSAGSTAYRVRIGHSRRTWRCSCPDAAQRGVASGPCKHAIAVARATVTASFEEMATLTAVLTVTP
jgi:uncharacterized Zn finger protein